MTVKINPNTADTIIQLRLALDNVAGAICLTDPDLRIVYCNAQYFEWYGVPADKFGPGTNLLDVYRFVATLGHYGPGDPDEIASERIKKVINPPTATLEDHTTDGRYLEVRRRRIDAAGVITIVTDVTDQRASKKQAAEKEARLLAALGFMTDSIFIMDKDKKFALINSRYREFFDLDKEQVYIGGPVEASIVALAERGLYGEGDIKEIVAERMQGLCNGETVQIEMPVNNGERIINIRKAPLDGGGAIVVGTDVTDQKNAEERLRAETKQLEESRLKAVELKNAAQSATDAKAAFLASMSHEIRTPMNGVVGMVDLLAQTKMDSDQSQMLQTIKDSGQSLLTIINDILDFSKIEAGKLDLETISTAVTHLIETAAQNLAPAALDKNVQLITHIDPDISDQLYIDPVRMRQILINLGGNAVKFSQQGEVLIKASLQSENSNSATILFEVVDSGIGISEEAQQQLFEEFSQADSSTTRRFGGTGLGLAISKRLVELMGGTIRVNSKLGEGSIFFCELTFEKTEKNDTSSDKQAELSGLHVLIATSSENYVNVCSQYLQHWNARATHIVSEKHCLNKIKELESQNDAVDVVFVPLPHSVEVIEQLEKDIAALGLNTAPRIAVGEDPRHSNDALQALDNLTVVQINPLTRVGFINGIAIAAGRASPEIEHKVEIVEFKGGRAPTPAEALEQGKLILLAEDNLTNQDVIRRQLTKLGYACEIANDGKEAFDMWRSKEYALLLTDCHMPEWDGFELTAAIRKDEAAGGKRAPIIAITANALRGEAERCKAGGMDDYMSKPVEMKILQETLHQWMGSGGITQLPEAESETLVTKTLATNSDGSSHISSAVNERVLKNLFGDDDEMFKEIITGFITPSLEAVGEIIGGAEKQSAEEIKQASHKLKSAAASIGAEKLSSLCQSLETAANESDWATINNRLPELKPLFGEVEAYITAL